MDDAKRIERIESLLEALVAERNYSSPVPLPLSEVAVICHLKERTLRDWISRKLLPAYRNGAAGPWRVFPADANKVLMSDSNLVPSRRVRILKHAA